jgi:ABC-2 type transport system ATP-binding protein
LGTIYSPADGDGRPSAEARPENVNGVRVVNLTVKYGSFTAVHGLDLSVNPGEVFAFLGPNGAGKSTTVKALTGILRPESGEIFICGKQMHPDSVETKKLVGVVPDGLGLFDSLTLWQHVCMAGSIYGLQLREMRLRAQELMEFLDLWNDRHVNSEAASNGMRKKTALAMALIHNPRVLFLDEPFEGLDPVVSRNVKDLLAGLGRRGTTIFITSHVLEILQEIVTSFAIIRKGTVLVRGSMREISDQGRTLEELYLEHFPNESKQELRWLR